MAIDAERRKVLEMIESGKMSAAEGLHLLDVLMDTDDEGEPEETEPPQNSASNTALPIIIHRWKWLWQIPLWVGIVLVVLGGVAMFNTIRSTGIGVWFILSWLPFLAGVLCVVLAWKCRSARWLYLHIRQRAGKMQGNYAFGFPIPLRFTAWLLRIFSDKISHKQNQSINHLIQSLETQASIENPITIDINGRDDGKRIQLMIG